MGSGLKKEDSAALKGIAIIIMVFLHCFNKPDRYNGYNLIFTPFTSEQLKAAAVSGKICVSIFAFVSGYGLMYGYSQMKQKSKDSNSQSWVIRHLVSTLSGLWFIAPFGYLGYGIVNDFQFVRWGSTPVMKGFSIIADCFGISKILGTKTVNGTWWYMGASIVFIVLIPVLYMGICKYGSFVSGAIIFLLPRVCGFGFTGGNSIYPFLFVMFLGMVSCKKDVFNRFRELRLGKSQDAGETVKFLFLLCAGIMVLWSSRMLDIETLWEYGWGIAPFVLILFLVIYVFRIRWIQKFLCFLGQHSLNIWLIHTFIRDWFSTYIWSVRYWFLIPLVIISISMVGSYMIFFLKRVTGYDRLIKSVTAKIK